MTTFQLLPAHRRGRGRSMKLSHLAACATLGAAMWVLLAWSLISAAARWAS